VLSMPQRLAFNTVDSVVVEETWQVLVVHVGHCWEILAAVKMFMVIMTFQWVLWGLPIAAVLEINFLNHVD